MTSAKEILAQEAEGLSERDAREVLELIKSRKDAGVVPERRGLTRAKHNRKQDFLLRIYRRVGVHPNRCAKELQNSWGRPVVLPDRGISFDSVDADARRIVMISLIRRSELLCAVAEGFRGGMLQSNLEIEC